jgi:CRP-like cAMP-binding protein
MHPAEIAQELTSHMFFSQFSDEFLFQIATLMRPISFSKKSKILAQGEQNKTLYFLRKGTVTIEVDGEIILETNAAGEVFGEMSIISEKPISADVVAKSDTDMFKLHMPDFDHVAPAQRDRFQFLLHKIHALILADRLIRTNEKAKLFEKTNRELQQAKAEIAEISAAKMNFLLSENKANLKKCLFIESSKKNQNFIKSAISGTGLHIEFAETLSLDSDTNAYIVDTKQSVDFPDSEKQKFILTGDRQIDFSNFNLPENTQNFITKDDSDRTFTVKNLITGLSKVLSKNIFGINRYLISTANIKSFMVESSEQREEIKNALHDYLKELGLRSNIIDRCLVAAEELLMNAIYDAPTDEDGNSLYNHLSRSEKVVLDEKHKAKFKYASDGINFVMCVTDPNGALKKNVLLDYLKRCYNNNAGHTEANKGGGGRGLHQIIENSDLTVFNIEPGKKTEVICCWNLEAALNKVAQIPTFHFYFLD